MSYNGEKAKSFNSMWDEKYCDHFLENTTCYDHC